MPDKTTRVMLRGYVEFPGRVAEPAGAVDIYARP